MSPLLPVEIRLVNRCVKYVNNVKGLAKVACRRVLPACTLQLKKLKIGLICAILELNVSLLARRHKSISLSSTFSVVRVEFSVIFFFFVSFWHMQNLPMLC